MDDIHGLRLNHLLSVLPYDEQKYLYPCLELVPVVFGQVLYENGCALTHAYFQITSIISLRYVMENDSSAEIAVVGNEGLIGVALFMGGDTMPNRGRSAKNRTRLPLEWGVTAACECYRVVKREFDRLLPDTIAVCMIKLPMDPSQKGVYSSRTRHAGGAVVHRSRNANGTKVIHQGGPLCPVLYRGVDVVRRGYCPALSVRSANA